MRKLCLVIAAGGIAATQVAGPASAVDLALGLGAAYAPDYEGSDDYTGVPLWNIRVGNLYDPETFIQLMGPQLRSNFVPDPHFRLGLVGQYVPDYNNVDDNQVEDIENAEKAVMLGPTIGYDFLPDPREVAALELDVTYDVANGNGMLVVPRGRVAWMPAERLNADIRITTSWASDDYMANFFDVDSRDSARSGLDRYDADAGFKDISLLGSLTYGFVGNWSVTGLASFGRLLGDAADSPIVDDAGDKNQFVTGALVGYSF